MVLRDVIARAVAVAGASSCKRSLGKLLPQPRRVAYGGALGGGGTGGKFGSGGGIPDARVRAGVPLGDPERAAACRRMFEVRRSL